MIYQSGYLTIKAIRKSIIGNETYKLDFPNVEVAQGFRLLFTNNT